MELQNFVKNHLEKEVKQNGTKQLSLAKDESQGSEVRFDPCSDIEKLGVAQGC